MIRMKKYFVILTLLAVIFTSFPSNYNVFALEGNNLEDQYSLLCALGFFEEGEFSKDSLVSKSAFVSCIIRALPEYENIVFNGTDTGFSDVMLDSGYAKDAYVSKSFGYVEGDKFFGDNPIDIEESCEILLNMLCYKNIYNKEGILNTANKLGLLKGISNMKNLSYGNMVILINNTLDTCVLTQTAFGESKRFDTYKNKTFLTEIFKVQEGAGIITSDENTKLSIAHSLNKGFIEINSKRYLIGESNAQEYLGCKVKYYYRVDENNNEDSTLLYTAIGNYNDIIEVDAIDIENFLNGEYYYRENSNNIKKASLSKDADIIYNGKAVQQPFSEYVPNNGKLRLIDNNNDGNVEVVIITDYEIIVVKNMDRSTYEIIDMYDGSKNIALDPYNTNKRFIIKDKFGIPFAVNLIKKWHILSVAKSLDGELINIIISEDSIDGVLNEKGDDNLVIDGVEYRTYGKKLAELNEYGRFYLDYKGKIVAFDKYKNTRQTSGYLIETAKSNGVSKRLLLKIFGESGNFNVYTTTEKCKIDSVVYTSADKAIERLRSVGGGDVAQLILYTTNNKGEIIEIELALPYSKEFQVEGFREDIIPKSKLDHKILNFQSSFRQEEGKTKVYVVPGDKNDEDQFAFYGKDDRYFQFNQYYIVTAYSVSTKLPYSEYIVVYLDSQIVDYASFENNPMVVDNVTRIINDNDEETYCLYGMQNNQRVSYMVKPSTSLKDLTFSSGDVIRVRINTKKEINAVLKLFDGKLRAVVGANPSSADPMAEYRHFYGNVYSNTGGTIFVTTKDVTSVQNKDDGEYAFSDIYRTIFRYDSKLKKVSIASSFEIKDYKMNPGDYSNVFIYHHYADPDLLVIYD